MRTYRWIGSLLSTALLLGSVAPSQAQSEPPYDPAIDVQLFEYAIGPRTFLTVADGVIAEKKQFSVDFLVSFFTNPFTIYNADPRKDEIIDERTQVVKSVVAGELSGAYGLSDKLQLGLSLPLVFSLAGDGLDPTTAMASPEGLRATGLGDLRAELKMQLWRAGTASLAGMAGVTLPSSVGTGGSDYLGDDLPSARGKMAFQWRNAGGTFSVGSNLGVIARKPRAIYSSTVGHQLTYGAAAAFKAASSVALVGELFGRTGLTSMDLDASPLEASGALRVQAGPSLSVLVGGGSGLVRGIGAPDLRFFASVGYAPDYRDSDGDGIPNLRDQCPLLPEDRDGFQDDDGCPDEDNDGDLREDAVDQCPNDKEDLDGFEDDDGCPELDNDKDGIPDADDRCPLEPEDGVGTYDKDGCPADKTDSDFDNLSDAVDMCIDEAEDIDGFEDWDGCPDIDNDGDGIPDDLDKCPLCREDKDGFEDGDGCPDLDNDSDGVPDATDACPTEPEAINGIDDFDGCPDEGGRQVAVLHEDRLVIGPLITFDRRDRLTGASRDAIDQAAAIMKMHPDVTMWLIVVAAPQQRGGEAATREKSQKWANVIKAQLLIRGVPSERIEALGAVADEPRTAIAVKERAEDTGEPMCPGELKAVAREPSAAPAPTAPATVTQPEAATSPATPVATPAAAPVTSDEPKPPEVTAGAVLPPEVTAGAVLPPELDALQGVSKNIEFKRNSAEMSRASRKALDTIAELMTANPAVRLEIGAHTDSRKGPDKSQEITQAQADAAVKYLVDKGIAADRLKGVGYGMDRPIEDNSKSKGRDANRRIELTFSVGQ